jgi:hypothetical protein
MEGRLKLRAVDEEDLRTLAAVLQDALVQVSDIEFLAGENRFVLVANRFRWEVCADDPARSETGAPAPSSSEAASGEEGRYERVLTGLVFDQVSAVRIREIDRRRRSRILEVLTIEPGAGTITLVLAGGAAIRLEVERISCWLEDLSEPWPTSWRPGHDPAGPSPQEDR